MNGESPPWGWTLAHLLVFNRLKKTLGLDRCRICATAAAPITKETLNYFMSVTLPLLEVYGMSESGGPQTISAPDRFRITAVGTTPEGFHTKLINPDADGNGEVRGFAAEICRFCVVAPVHGSTPNDELVSIEFYPITVGQMCILNTP